MNTVLLLLVLIALLAQKHQPRPATPVAAPVPAPVAAIAPPAPKGRWTNYTINVRGTAVPVACPPQGDGVWMNADTLCLSLAAGQELPSWWFEKEARKGAFIGDTEENGRIRLKGWAAKLLGVSGLLLLHEEQVQGTEPGNLSLDLMPLSVGSTTDEPKNRDRFVRCDDSEESGARYRRMGSTVSGGNPAERLAVEYEFDPHCGF